MTGKETWEFIAPILAMHGGTQREGLDQFDEAYVMVYGALKFWDEHHKENKHKPVADVGQYPCNECRRDILPKYEAKVITHGNCMMCGKELTEGLFFCKECEAKAVQGRSEVEE